MMYYTPEDFKEALLGALGEDCEADEHVSGLRCENCHNFADDVLKQAHHIRTLRGFREEHGWVVECYINNDLYYYSARATHGINGVTRNGVEFSRDPNDALRFGRNEDAMIALTHLCHGAGRVTQHIWSYSTDKESS